MRSLIARIKTFVHSEDGPTAVEYAVMLALIVGVCMVAISLIGEKVSGTFTTVESKVPDGS